MTGTECSHLLLISHFYFIAQACMPDHRQLSAKGQPLLAPTLHASLVVLQAPVDSLCIMCSDSVTSKYHQHLVTASMCRICVLDL